MKDVPQMKGIAKRLDNQGMGLETQAVRAVAGAYGGMKLADLIALLGVVEGQDDFRVRVRESDRLMGAFNQAAVVLGTPPAALNDLLRGAVTNGATAAAEMLAVQAAVPEMFDAFRIKPDTEIEFLKHTGSRLTKYWGIEQQRLANEVEGVFVDALQKGQGRQQIEARLRERVRVSRSRASLIARNELGNAASYAMEQTQRQAGCTEYIWSSATDKRVRPSHRARNGKRFKWDEPPSDGHPGQPIQCRCAALAVLPDNWRTAGATAPLQTPPRTFTPPVALTPLSGLPGTIKRGDPVGVPVGRALAINAADKKLKPARDAVALIEQVHGDGTLPTIPVTTGRLGRGVQGAYRFRISGAGPIDIRLKAAQDHPRMTMTHEFGHFLHDAAIGGVGAFRPLDPAIRNVVDVAMNSAGMKALQARARIGRHESVRLSSTHVAYLMQPAEVWARAYAQYIAARTKDPTMLKELTTMRNSDYGKTYLSQWDDADFGPIEEAITDLLMKKGWIQK